MAVSIHITHNQLQVRRLFQEIRKLGGSLKPVLEDIAFLGENSTRARFRSQTGPDGERWKPSLRAQLAGGKTLTKDGHLGNSIASGATAREARWGTNRVYAAIHQLGGKIDIPARSQQAYFRQDARTGLIGNRFVKKRRSNFAQWVTIGPYSIQMPARPFLGLSDTDRGDILDLVGEHLSNLFGRSAPGGA
ncbi:MAG: phage virion morphogenesis protein [Pseudomonas sp.]|nr:phage virion morphogenesis protein [Pseudomonas sp.]